MDKEDAKDVYSEGLTVGMSLGRKQGVVKSIAFLATKDCKSAAVVLQELYEKLFPDDYPVSYVEHLRPAVDDLRAQLAAAIKERDRLRAALEDAPGLEAYALALRDLIPLARGHVHVTTGNRAEDRLEVEMAEARIWLAEGMLERAEAAIRAKAGLP